MDKCETCDGWGTVVRTSYGGMIGYAQWNEECPACGSLAQAMKQFIERQEIAEDAEGFDPEIESLGDILGNETDTE